VTPVELHHRRSGDGRNKPHLKEASTDLRPIVERENFMQKASANHHSSAASGAGSVILDSVRAFASTAMSSHSLTEECLARISNPAGEGKRTFIKIWADEARTAAKAQDELRGIGYAPSPIAGIPVSVKDMLDVAGEVTLAGSKALDDAPPAARDAPVIQRLKAAGAVLTGRTNMAQFAFSILGLNPHFGTPKNPWDRSRIPGGSSSGAAVSVADGMSIAAIGSDTVGSIRAPAALCGIVGFRPTQRSVPLQGTIPLSTTLDTVGPLARTVQDAALVYATISGEPWRSPQPLAVKGLRLAIPQTRVLDDLSAAVARAFERASGRLSEAGADLVDASFRYFAEIEDSHGCGVIEHVEALAWHKELLDRRGHEYDPNVRARVEKGATIAAWEYAAMLEWRKHVIARFDRDSFAYDAIILPTVAITAPTMEECERDEGGFRSKLLRNPSLFNFMDRPAISIPIHVPGEAPVGLMVVGERNEDWRLLSVARALEAVLVN
jgi:aspartyl-tRNA(Asn)/glutamyl-tRNA(Gln) amidotransferase subunit A